MSKKVAIDRHALSKISYNALRAFHDHKGPLPEDGKEAQVYLVMKGLESYLVSLGVQPQFDVKPVREDNDTTPIDDL